MRMRMRLLCEIVVTIATVMTAVPSVAAVCGLPLRPDMERPWLGWMVRHRLYESALYASPSDDARMYRCDWKEVQLAVW